MADITMEELHGGRMTSIVEEAVRMLEGSRRPDAMAVLKNMAKQAMGRNVNEKDILFWPAGMLLLGMSDTLSLENSYRPGTPSPTIYDRIRDAAGAHVDAWKQGGAQIRYVDDALAGASFLQLFLTTGDARYRKAADAIASYLMETPKDSEGGIIYAPKHGNDYVLADGIGQTSMFLIRFGRQYMNGMTLGLGVNQLRMFARHGMDKKSGLPYHGYSLQENSKLGILGWGRAIGWLMLGLSEYACGMMPGEGKNPELLDWYNELSERVLGYQRTDGSFSWQVPGMEGHPDSSATGMIIYALARGVRMHVLPERYRSQLMTAGSWLLLQTKEGKVGSSLSSCEDIAVHRQVYENNAWGQGAALAALAELSLL